MRVPNPLRSLIPLLVLGGAAIAGQFAGDARGAVIAEHIGSTDPTLGSPDVWTRNGPGTVGVASGATPAWSITGRTSPFYSHATTAAENLDAYTNGWILSARVRVNDTKVPLVSGDLGANVEFTTDANSDRQRWFLTFGSAANGDPMVKVGFSSQPIHTVVGGAGLYHLYQLVYDPVTATADLLIDGVEVRSNIAPPASHTLNRVVFGSNNGGTSQTHNVDYALVRIETVPEPASLTLFGLTAASAVSRHCQRV